jgi:hypothetical protein
MGWLGSKSPSCLFLCFPFPPKSQQKIMQIQEVKSLAKTQLVDAHSHVRALGLREDGTAEPISSGFAGQEAAREVRLIPPSLISGRGACRGFNQGKKDGWTRIAPCWSARHRCAFTRRTWS